MIDTNPDKSRVHVVAWMEDRIKEALYNISEKKMFESMQSIYELCIVAKTLTDCELTFMSLELFGVLLMNLNFKQWAVSIFEVMRDIGYEQLNWSFVLQAFDLLGRSLQQKNQFKDASIAYKKMLQLAWVTNSQEFET